ncbi:hypothetical protein [Methylocystis sp.]|uniref:hypothetical protein n=1 Tax=Methylocystis sp. TaxID=1911079 RepID=UPI003D11F09F
MDNFLMLGESFECAIHCRIQSLRSVVIIVTKLGESLAALCVKKLAQSRMQLRLGELKTLQNEMGGVDGGVEGSNLLVRFIPQKKVAPLF